MPRHAETRSLPTYHLGQALLDAGRYHEAVMVTLDGVAISVRRSRYGLRRGLDALAAEGSDQVGVVWPTPSWFWRLRDAFVAFNAVILPASVAHACGGRRTGGANIDGARGFLAEVMDGLVHRLHSIAPRRGVSGGFDLIAGDGSRQRSLLSAGRQAEASTSHGCGRHDRDVQHPGAAVEQYVSTVGPDGKQWTSVPFFHPPAAAARPHPLTAGSCRRSR